MSGAYHLPALCATLGASRSGYYAWRQRRASPRAHRDDQLAVCISRLHARSRGTYGSPRIVRDLREEGQHVGHNRVARLMRTAGLWGRQRRRYRVVTTDSHHTEPIAPNRLAEQPPPSRPDQVWVSDLTYVPTAEGWLYVAGVLDRYSRRLVGWAMGSSLDTALPLAALQMALRQRQPPPGLIHHSDRGGPVCQWRLSRRPRRAWRGRLDEPQGPLLRQRRHGGLLEQPEKRAGASLSLRDAGRGPHRDLRLHRGLLQPHPQTLRAGLQKPARLRNLPQLITINHCRSVSEESGEAQ